MQNDQIYSEIKTREDFQILNNELDLLEASLYKTGKNGFNETLNGSIRKSIADIINKASGPESATALEKVIKELRIKLSEIKFMELTLAYDPSYKLLDRLSIWVKEKVGQNIALSIIVDKEIIGGVIISYEGKYGDFSLDHKLREVLKNYV